MPRGGSTATGASLALKRLAVSAPKDDWPKPPSLVGGGLGMARCEGPPKHLPVWQLEAHQGGDWFVFERSESLQQLQVSLSKVRILLALWVKKIQKTCTKREVACRTWKGAEESVRPHAGVNVPE